MVPAFVCPAFYTLPFFPQFLGRINRTMPLMVRDLLKD